MIFIKIAFIIMTISKMTVIVTTINVVMVDVLFF
jgi:hypothetical protein